MGETLKVTIAAMRSRKRLLLLLKLLVLGAVGLLVLSKVVESSGGRHIVAFRDAPEAQASIVLGALVERDGTLCPMLEDRVRTGVNLYRAGKVKKLLMTGDHGQKSYDEVNHMRRYAESLGVPTEDIFMDHAGFSTYESMYRAMAVFQVKSAVVVTQRFHLARAIYLARSFGIDAKGVIADRRPYLDAIDSSFLALREELARCKAFIQVHLTHPKPTFLGPAIPITGDGRATHD